MKGALMLLGAACVLMAQPTEIHFIPQHVMLGRLQQYLFTIKNQNQTQQLPVAAADVYNAAQAFRINLATYTNILEEKRREEGPAGTSMARKILFGAEAASYIMGGLIALAKVKTDLATGREYIDGPIKISQRWAPALLGVGVLLRAGTTWTAAKIPPVTLPEENLLPAAGFLLPPRGSASYIVYGIQVP
jgi:hypothetical protein